MRKQTLTVEWKWWGNLDPERLKVRLGVGRISNDAQASDTGESLLVRAGDLPPPLNDGVQPIELPYSYRGLNVSHPVVEAKLEVLLSRRQDA